MSISYDVFTEAFVRKITEFEFLNLTESVREDIVDSYMKNSISQFGKICNYDFLSVDNPTEREFDISVPSKDLIEIIDIISDGMLVQWMKPFTYNQENLEAILNTSDYSSYSPAELLMRIGNAYSKAQNDFKNAMREYSYNHGDLTDLHI